MIEQSKIGDITDLIGALNPMKPEQFSTLSKTPSFSDTQMATLLGAAKQLMISPGLFKKKQQSRFKFAHSVDPLKNKVYIEDEDGDEI